MSLTATEKSRINQLGALQGVGNLGELIESAETPPQGELDMTKTVEDFAGTPSFSLKNGGAAGGATGNTNVMITERGTYFEYHVKGAEQTATVFSKTITGLDVEQDNTVNEGTEITQGIAAGSKHYFTAQTDRFYVKASINLPDVSGTDDCAFGLRKAEAYQAAIDSYDEAAFLNVISGNLYQETILNNAETVSTDTTDNVADGETVTLQLEYDDRVGLERGIALANELKAVINGHLADATEHTTAVDTANVITTADAYDLATLKALVLELSVDYDAHNADAKLAAAWVYHIAQVNDHALVAHTAVTTLAAALNRLNDIKAKYDAHEASAVSHTLASLHQSSVHSAGCLTFKKAIGTASLAEVTVYKGFSFDDAEKVVPFFYFLHDTDICEDIELRSWEVGRLL